MVKKSILQNNSFNNTFFQSMIIFMTHRRVSNKVYTMSVQLTQFICITILILRPMFYEQVDPSFLYHCAIRPLL